MECGWHAYDMAIRYHSKVLHANYDGDSQFSRMKLMDKTHLSHVQFREYLELLIGRGLVKYELTGSKFRITELRIAFLKAGERIEELFPIGKSIPSRIYDSIGVA